MKRTIAFSMAKTRKIESILTFLPSVGRLVWFANSHTGNARMRKPVTIVMFLGFLLPFTFPHAHCTECALTHWQFHSVKQQSCVCANWLHFILSSYAVTITCNASMESFNFIDHRFHRDKLWLYFVMVFVANDLKPRRIHFIGEIYWPLTIQWHNGSV